jgi:hypothetical protein
MIELQSEKVYKLTMFSLCVTVAVALCNSLIQ